MRVLVGSKAVQHHLPNWREPKDVDHWMSPDEARILKEDGTIDRNFDDKSYVYNGQVLQGLKRVVEGPYIPSLNTLYTIKFSHSFWDVKWLKTAKDIVELQKAGAQLDEELFQLLYTDWCVVHKKLFDKSKVNLMEPNEKFFKKSVDRKFDHDFLHECAKYYDKPIYMSMKHPDKMHLAYCSKSLWEKLSYEDKLKACREELMVIAAERFIIPQLDLPDDSKLKNEVVTAHRKSIHKMVTTASKGWFPKFIMCNLSLLWYPDEKQLEFYNVVSKL